MSGQQPERKAMAYRLEGCRVRIAGVLYPLRTHGGSELAAWGARQRALVLDGSYGPVVHAYALACAEAGVPCRLGWRGVINALGDHAEVTLPAPVVEDTR